MFKYDFPIHGLLLWHRNLSRDFNKFKLNFASKTIRIIVESCLGQVGGKSTTGFSRRQEATAAGHTGRLLSTDSEPKGDTVCVTEA